jgi:hypothetical protein
VSPDCANRQCAKNRGKIEVLQSRGVAQPGSAPALGAGGREFESRRPDHSRPSGLQPTCNGRATSSVSSPHHLFTRDVYACGLCSSSN